MPKWVYPLDPDCPDVQKFYEMADDPYMQMSGCFGEFLEDFERQHRAKCQRCMEYGCANVDIG